jgi:hypothetical protein
VLLGLVDVRRVALLVWIPIHVLLLLHSPELMLSCYMLIFVCEHLRLMVVRGFIQGCHWRHAVHVRRPT